MNKREKEFFLGQLESEKAVLRSLKRQYERALQDITDRIRVLQSDELTQSRIYRIDYQKALKAQVEAILDKLQADEYDTIHQYLNNSYTDGYIGTMYAMSGQGVHVISPIDQKAAVKAIVTDSKLKATLYNTLGTDMKTLKRKISEEITRGIATALPYAQIARNITNQTNMPLANAKRIVRTEAHRIQEASSDDARNAVKASGADVVKQWDASLDRVTRPIHRQLDGQIRETDEPFEAGGYKVMYPGGFGVASQDCNCRCVALTRARWALDENELQTLKDRAKYFGIDKSKEFEDYKQKYLKASKLLESPGNIGEKAIPYSERGIKLDERIKGYMKDLTKSGQYVSSKAGTYTTEDMAILTTETGVEYTLLTIGDKAYMIRGTENGTLIPEELYEELVKNKGTLDYHSHPYIGDIMPSKSDRDVLKALNWQEKSGIIDPRGNVFRFDAEGHYEPEENSPQRNEDFYAELFGGDD